MPPTKFGPSQAEKDRLNEIKLLTSQVSQASEITRPMLKRKLLELMGLVKNG